MPPRSKYETHVKNRLDDIIAWRHQGLSEEDIANELKLHYSTLYKYKFKYPELANALWESKQKLGNKMKRSMIKEAMGYEYEEIHEHVEAIPDPNDNKKKIVTKIHRKSVKKWYRASATLLMFYLCNLLPDEFKRIDKEAVEELKEKVLDAFSDDRINKAFKVLYDEEEKKEAKKRLDKLDDKDDLN